MTKFDVQIDEALDLRIIHVLEKVTAKEVAAFLDEQRSLRTTKNVIWVLSPGSLQLLDLEELKELMVSRMDYILQRAGGTTTFVSSEVSEQMLSKWYAYFAETLPFNEVGYGVAATLDEAIDMVRARQGAGKVKKGRLA